MSSTQETRCFSCSALAPDIEGPVHRYMDSSPGCWSIYGEVLAREYSDRAYFAKHRLTVDAYAVQHPGKTSRQSVQSVTLHLASLYVVFEHGYEPDEATELMRQVSRHKPKFTWLEPPSELGARTVRDVWEAQGAEQHLEAAEEWARAAWSGWHRHHARIRAWVQRAQAE